MLEVGGYLGLTGHGIGEWAAQGGTVTFAGGEAVTQGGSSINLSGGTLNVQSGYIQTSWIRGTDGRLYDISTAPADLTYQGLYKGYKDAHARWGDTATRYFYSPLIAPRQHYEDGYTVGRDAGRLIVSTAAAVLEGDAVSSTYQGPRQTDQATSDWDGYTQSQDAAARGAQLILGKYETAVNTNAAQGALGVVFNLNPTQQKIVFGEPDAIADTLQPSASASIGGGNGGNDGNTVPPLPDDRQGTAYLASALIDRWNLGGIVAAASISLDVNNPLGVQPGGTIQLNAPRVHVNGNLTARGGAILLGNVIDQMSAAGTRLPIALPGAADTTIETRVAIGVTLDASGAWLNLMMDPGNIGLLPYQDGGSVTIRSSGDVTVAAGSLIDVSSGAALLRDGTLHGGAGGNATLAAGFVLPNQTTISPDGLLTLDGEVRGYGVNGGGTLTIEAARAIGIGADLLAQNGLLQPGETASVDLRLAQDYTVRAGETIPADIQALASVVGPNRRLAAVGTIDPNQTVTLAADWRLPYSVQSLIASDGNTYFGGQVIPAGTVLRNVVGTLQAGYLLPADAFPNGLALSAPALLQWRAGDTAVADMDLAAGTRIVAGHALSRQAAVEGVTKLGTDLFQSGFAHYQVTGHEGVAVGDGAALNVSMPVLFAEAASVGSLTTGSSLSGPFVTWTPPLYQENAATATLTQRAGASLVLQAGSPASLGAPAAPLVIGAGAQVEVDPGQAITLWSNGGQVTVDGRLQAPGGAISITSLPPTDLTYQGSLTRSIWIGDDAVLDAAGRTYVAYDPQGRAYGIAPDGGSIDIGLSDAFVVVRPGAVLDASGATAQVDASAGGSITALPRPLLLAGAGGSIGLHSYVGIVIDGTLSAHAGGSGAAGGTLTVEMANRTYDPSVEPIYNDYQVLHNLTLVQQHAASALAGDLAPGQVDAGLQYGTAVLGVDQVQAGGFDALTLATHDLFVFDGDIDLALAGSLNLRNGLLTTAAMTPDAKVRLAAPYIRLDGGAWAGSPSRYSPGIYDVRPGYRADGTSSLTLAADLIDISGRVQSGLVGIAGDGPISPVLGFFTITNPRAANASGFDSVTLRSSGDVRLANAAVLAVTGDLTIEATQIYPASGERGVLLAGLISPDPKSTDRSPWDADRSLVIRSNGQPAPMPDSVFGQLLLAAPILDQGGVVRAPLGTIALNDLGGQLNMNSWIPNSQVPIDGSLRLVLREGSLTSVSAAGLVLPYGGTSDGLTYRGADGTLYNLAGNAVERENFNQAPDTGVLPQGISLGGGTVVAEAGAVLDLSGGGDLRGAGFVSGRGGSVDVLTTPLVNANPVANRNSSASNQVYAILPGHAADYAPLIADKGAGDPAIGRQITIGAQVPGLAAGTYTLLPASFALLPGAYRVEIGAQVSALASSNQAGAAVNGLLPSTLQRQAAANGTWNTYATIGTANTGVRDALPSQVLITPGQVVRQYSQYNEMSYTDFAVAQAALFGNVRPMLPSDGKILRFNFVQDDDAVPLQFAGRANLDAAAGGLRGQVSVLGDAPIDIVGGAADAPTPGVITLSADTLSALNARALSIGGTLQYFDAQGSLGGRNQISLGKAGVPSPVTISGGATLRAGQIFLIGPQIDVEGGAVLDTRGMSDAGVDSTLGYVYGNGNAAALAVGNGWLDFLPATGAGHVTVRDGATLLTQGTVAFAAPTGLDLGQATLGARYVTVSQDQINVGTAATLAAAGDAGTLQQGLQLTQEMLERLLRPTATAGVPALERLSLTAGGAFNFYGSVVLDTGSTSAQMVFNTPAFYGLGGADDVVRIATRNFVWNGIVTGSGTTDAPYVGVQPVAVQPGGPGTGSGQLVIAAQTVQFGYDALSQPQRQTELPRLALGFDTVQVVGAASIGANNKGALTVARSQDADGTLHGGALALVTPLLTGQAGSGMRYVAGGAITVSAPQGAAPAATSAIGELGATVTLQGASVALDTAVGLPSGVLKITADEGIALGNNAQVDLAGRAVTFFDVTKYSWGGSIDLQSSGGDITQAAGSRIDVSAGGNDAGSLSASAAAGSVALAGTLAGQGAAGFENGYFALTANRIGNDDFTALNLRLNDGGFYGARSFVVKQGDLTVGDGVRAQQVNIAADGGSLTVDGTIDASGGGPGQIVLAARGNLTLTGRAVLDAHGNTLITDSYGAPIDASNRAKITLAAVDGTVSLAAGATLDLRSPDGVARGSVEINAPRVGSTGASATGADGPANATGDDIAVQAAGPLTIRGAQSIALNGTARYDNAPVDPNDANGQLITQGYLNLIDTDSQAFDAAARANAGLQTRIAGLAAYGDSFHLRPGVEIDSRTPNGNLNVAGDLDLSGYRYGPNANRDVASALYGAGEPMKLVLRAGGDLNIHGSINDGFAPPPATPDDGAWLVHQQIALTGQAVPQDITFDIPYYAPWIDFYYVFPSAETGVGNPVVVSGSVTDLLATYNPGDEIPGFLYGTVTITAGTVLTSTVPGGADITLNGPRAQPGRMWALSSLLAPGTLSASIRLVSGADLQAADTRALRTAAQLVGSGDMVLNDPHNATSTELVPVQAPSVVRTGTGDLDLYVGGNYRQESLYGVYTAGTQVAGTGADSGYNAPRAVQPDGTVLGANYGVAGSDYESALSAQRMWFTQNGGDFTLSAQGDITGYMHPESSSVGDWLWRQGGAELGQRTAWGLNFGSYVIDHDDAGGVAALGLAAYSGVGALGGGNATIRAGRNIGVAGDPTSGLVAAVGGSGRVTDSGTLLQTGGGTLAVSAGGQISFGLYTDLRGDVALSAADLGTLVLQGYGTPNVGDPRAAQAYTAYRSARSNAVNFAPGDGVLRVRTLGDAVLNALVDPGRVGERAETQAMSGDAGGSMASWFTLWTNRTAVDLTSLGGNVSPFGDLNLNSDVFDIGNVTAILPGRISAVAAGGSIYYTGANLQAAMMMPTPDGQLDLLARGLVSGDGANSRTTASGGSIGLLGTASDSMATPLHAAWRVVGAGGAITDSNYWDDATYPADSVAVYQYAYDAFSQRNAGSGGALFMFGPNTLTDDSAEGAGVPSHIYALQGDVLGVNIGGTVQAGGNPFDPQVQTYYQASKPVRIMAGGDIVSSGGLIIQGSAADVSVVAAARDVLYANFSIAGPGTLEVSAGGQVYQGNQASLTSLGPLAVGDTRPGADIVVQAGVGAGAPGEGATDYAGFARLYLDPINQADASPGHALAGQPGKVAKTYDAELLQWLSERFSYTGAGGADALAYFIALPAEQQRVFGRKVYYAELLAGGREYNDANSPRFGSYLRGREAIAALFPATDAQGKPIVRVGDLTLFQSGADSASNGSLRTIAGGTIQTLTPGGQTIAGVEGVTPSITAANPAGIVTQGSGDIQMYSQGSVLLGLSRIMTSFGGAIQIWSANGDINAGRGSKTTLVYTPPKLVYDDYANITLSPNAPASGAGIATLNPIPEVPPGDVDLIAPLGTIDAGEAGIRVSGNINIAALHVVNAANIQVQGKSAGIPVVAAINTSALTSASAAASSAANAAQDVTRQQKQAARENLPSIITVQVLGFGNEAAGSGAGGSGGNSLNGAGNGTGNGANREPVSYDPASAVQMLGVGQLNDVQRARLTDAERSALGM